MAEETTTVLSAEERKRIERAELDKKFSASVSSRAEDLKLKIKQEQEADAAERAEELRQKGAVVPPKKLTPWQLEAENLELEGIVGLGKSAEDVTLREDRKDWKN